MVIIFFKGSTFYRHVLSSVLNLLSFVFEYAKVMTMTWAQKKKNSTTDKTEAQNIFKVPESETCAILEASRF